MSNGTSASQQEKMRTRSIGDRKRRSNTNRSTTEQFIGRGLRSLGLKNELREDSPALSEKKKPLTTSYKGSRPAELFRKDLITTMTGGLCEGETADDALTVVDPWRHEWNEGVQVPVDLLALPKVTTRHCQPPITPTSFKMGRKLLSIKTKPAMPADVYEVTDVVERAGSQCRYDLDDLDSHWLKLLNEKRLASGLTPLTEDQMETILAALEDRCYEALHKALQDPVSISAAKSGREFDENAVCDVCLSGESSSDDEIVFCDGCDMCVHESCYGIRELPLDNEQWLCRACQLSPHEMPQCCLCPNPGGALKCTRSATRWAHVACVLWIPEVRFGDVEMLEPVSHLKEVPEERWLLRCSVCDRKQGACIQCSLRNCRVAYHVTCAQRNRHYMEMRSDPTESDGVSLVSYCERHSAVGSNGQTNDADGDTTRKLRSPQGVGRVKERIAELHSRFHCLVNPASIANDLGLEAEKMWDVFEYWKLKRTRNGCRALLMPLDDGASSSTPLERQHGSDLVARAQQLVQLRQNLEKARNLCYMVERREKLKAKLLASMEMLSMRVIEVLEENSERLSAREMARYALYLNQGAETPPTSPMKTPTSPVKTPSSPVKLHSNRRVETPETPKCVSGCPERRALKRRWSLGGSSRLRVAHVALLLEEGDRRRSSLRARPSLEK